MQASIEATKVAAHLLKIKAVQLNIQAPFTWSAGWKSPIYCDNRLILSYPAVRTFIRDSFVSSIRTLYPETQALAGVATGGIGMGALVADAMGLPFVYVRPKPKAHGLQNQVEGRLLDGLPYLVIEDLISTGKSSVAAVQALQRAGANVLSTIAIFGYGFPIADAAFANIQMPFHTLTSLEVMLEQAAALNYIQASEMATVMRWKENPAVWGEGRV